MDNPKPYAGTSGQRLTALINTDNNSALQLGVDFTLSAPQPYSDSAGRNTRVMITALDSAYDPRPKPLHYKRLDLRVLDQLPEGWVTAVSVAGLPFSVHDILDDINAALGLDLQPEEVVNTTYTTGALQYRLVIDDTVSLAWIDSDYRFRVVFPEGIPLDSVIQVTTLNGPNLPAGA